MTISESLCAGVIWMHVCVSSSSWTLLLISWQSYGLDLQIFMHGQCLQKQNPMLQKTSAWSDDFGKKKIEIYIELRHTRNYNHIDHLGWNLCRFTSTTESEALISYFSVLKKTAHPSTCLRSDSDMVLARDLGLKKPSYPCSFSSGKKKL